LVVKQVSADILASGSLDKTLKLWNISNGQLIRSLTGHTDWILWSVDLLEDGGQTLVSGSYDTTIKLWSWNTGQMLKLIDTGSYILSLAVINPIMAPTTTTTTSK
jgi:WD40 repeat protein